jgi:hypothetical protein
MKSSTPSIETIYEEANRMASIQQQQQLAFAAYEQAVSVAENGGLFTLSPNLLTYMYWRIALTNPTFDRSISTPLIMLDDYQMPIEIVNGEETFMKWTEIHVSALNSLNVEMKRIKRARSVKAMVE